MEQDLVLDTRLESVKNLAWWLYMGHAISFVFSLGMFSFIPLILNYVKRDDAIGTFVHSHHGWMIRSFWWYAIWIFIGWVVLFFSLGLLFFVSYAIWALAWLWKAYRLIRGFIDLNSNKAMS